MKKLMDIKSDFLELSMPMALIVVKMSDKLEILFANEIFVKLLGCETFDELRDFYHDSAWNFVSQEDFASLHEKIKQREGKTDPFEVSYRAVKKDGNLIWLFQNSRHTYDENGEEIVVAYYTDITSQKLMEQQILAGANKYETLINSIPGGVGMYRCNDNFTPIFMSERTYELCSMTRQEYEQATKNSTLDVFHPDDRQGLLDAIKLATTQRKKFEYTHRVKQKDGTYRWMRVAGQVIDSPEGDPILYTVFTDLHEQIKAEQALRESEFRYAAAVKASNINIWEYFYATDTMTIFSTSPKVNPKNLIINNYLNSVIEEQHITNDSAAALFEMIRKLKACEAEVTADLWIRDRPEDEFWCERVVYTNIFDESGNPYKAYCVGHDVTKEKEAEKRYLDELSYREAMQKATVASINVNLTCNTILDYKSNFDEITDNMRKSSTVQDYFLTVYAELTNKEMRDKCAALFNRTSLMQRFADGETTVSMELARRIEGRRYWTVLTAHMMKKRETNEIVAFYIPPM
ncbi:MAG: PAS domain-containing protein [Oscillospiraceae bacterium]